ncbi:MAG TPA: YbbR-like domain-containing protein [Clostridiales bacterium]|jgi:YbbR domain-containing protein|nr:YbbR-like domain-containing protein [Clostridiales bacterium]HQP69923.1 YbbR-like domain-containing protein [Clostridiales bacterium]
MNRRKKTFKKVLYDTGIFLADSVKHNFVTKLIIFILCTVLWFYINLQKDFENIINIPITVSNIQKGKTLLNPIPATARVKIKSKGKAILMSDFNNEIFLEIDATGFSDSVNVRLNTDQFVKTVDRDIDPVSIYQPLEVILQFDRSLTKKVPVKVNSEISLAPGYINSGGFITEPDSVTISGPESKVKKIERIESEKDIKNDLIKDYSTKIRLILPESEVIRYSSTNVSVFQKISRKGISVFKTPVRILNKPEKINLIIDPVAVDISVTGPVDELQKITPESFGATVDYNELDKTDFQIPLKIETKLDLEWSSSADKIKAISY